MIAQIQENKTYSPEEYLEFEENSPERHEYIAGEIRLMTGGTPNHATIELNFASILNFGLKRQPYNVSVADLRVWIPEKQIHTYPDVMIIARPLEYAKNRRDTVTNPLLIGEVLSKSTRNYDKGDKFTAYRTIPSFQEYILIDQYSPRVEHYRKTSPNQWLLTEYDNLEAVFSLSSVPISIELADLYDNVDFEEEG
ncbi:Uma2 family endonuclease [Pannus brasiliensis CCIBt3594]|uniref:Uma2 family endonuclease n=1 Tax=Pannus brasiliensis CCIBt3594 TaxID=1427578 RepID=A0AAW9QWS9_9CHRO